MNKNIGGMIINIDWLELTLPNKLGQQMPVYYWQLEQEFDKAHFIAHGENEHLLERTRRWANINQQW